MLSVRENGAASQAGIQQGDVLVGLHKWEMTQLSNVKYVLQRPDLESLAPLQFCVIRDGQVQWGWVRPRQ